MSQFSNFVKERLARFGCIYFKKMFGVNSIYLDGKMIGFIFDGEFYIKAQPVFIKDFTKDSIKQFSYTKKGKVIFLNFFVLDTDVFEDEACLERLVYHVKKLNFAGNDKKTLDY